MAELKKVEEICLQDSKSLLTCKLKNCSPTVVDLGLKLLEIKNDENVHKIIFMCRVADRDILHLDLQGDRLIQFCDWIFDQYHKVMSLGGSSGDGGEQIQQEKIEIFNSYLQDLDEDYFSHSMVANVIFNEGNCRKLGRYLANEAKRDQNSLDKSVKDFDADPAFFDIDGYDSVLGLLEPVKKKSKEQTNLNRLPESELNIMNESFEPSKFKRIKISDTEEFTKESNDHDAYRNFLRLALTHENLEEEKVPQQDERSPRDSKGELSNHSDQETNETVSQPGDDENICDNCLCKDSIQVHLRSSNSGSNVCISCIISTMKRCVKIFVPKAIHMVLQNGIRERLSLKEQEEAAVQEAKSKESEINFSMLKGLYFLQCVNGMIMRKGLKLNLCSGCEKLSYTLQPSPDSQQETKICKCENTQVIVNSALFQRLKEYKKNDDHSSKSKIAEDSPYLKQKEADLGALNFLRAIYDSKWETLRRKNIEDTLEKDRLDDPPQVQSAQGLLFEADIVETESEFEDCEKLPNKNVHKTEEAEIILDEANLCKTTNEKPSDDPEANKIE